MGYVRLGTLSYRIRHRKPLSDVSEALSMSGYGVELALKRTDYIVIDDRDGEKIEDVDKDPASPDLNVDGEEMSDLKPLSASQLSPLGLKASSFILQSKNPFETLLKVSQDFPKYSSVMANHNISQDFLAEHLTNRATSIPPGTNVMFLNGLQLIERQIDAFRLLSILRTERHLVQDFQDIGFTPLEAIALLGHEAIVAAKLNDEVSRYDWTDETDGGNVIIWLNDLEKDKRYEHLPMSIDTV
jgi:UDP-glucose:glycoprotein glucosyltransferase